MAENITPRQTELRTRLATNLKYFRGLLDISQEVLAGRAGMHRTHIGQIELGRRSVTVDTLALLADVLGIEESDLLIQRDVIPTPVTMGRKKKST